MIASLLEDERRIRVQANSLSSFPSLKYTWKSVEASGDKRKSVVSERDTGNVSTKVERQNKSHFTLLLSAKQITVAFVDYIGNLPLTPLEVFFEKSIRSLKALTSSKRYNHTSSKGSSAINR